MIIGSPAKVVRELSAEQQAGLLGISQHYVDNAKRFKAGLNKIA
jgi:carbonic anhydrase/acetyltransferase-like protein (isoleucine patch superfamily)